MHRLLICALAAALLGAAPSPSPSPLPQITHVYTSDRSDETLSDAARTTFVVTRAQIQQHGYRTVADAIESIPAIELSPYGAIGAGTQYGIRGSDSAQVLVLINGLPAPGSFSNSVEIGTMPLGGVDRIEVIEGGGSTLFGTGSIGGIINIITAPGAPRATARLGSFADREISIETPAVNFSRIVSNNGFSLPDGTMRGDSDYSASALRATHTLRAGDFQLTGRIGILSDHLGAPGPVEFLSPSSREDDLNENADLTASRGTSKTQSTFQAGASRQAIAFTCDASNDPDCFLSAPSLNTETRVYFNGRNAIQSTRSRLIYGFDLSRGTVRADAGGFFVTSALAQAAAYVQDSFEIGSGRVYAGLRGERDGALGGEFSPSLGIIQRLTPFLTLRANAASAFRAPNASELYFPGFGNPALHAERARVADLSLTASDERSSAALGWFTNYTRDLIVPVLIDPVTFTFAPENINHAAIGGFTLDLRSNSSRYFTVNLNVTDLYRAQNADKQTRLPDDPVFTANAGFDYNGSGVLQAFGLRDHLVGQRGDVDPSQPRFTQPIAYGGIDGYITLRAAPNLLLSLRGYNLGNARYAAVSGFPMPGASYILEISTH